ncbi:hypothetical protein Spla01_05640 [Streptomyces platensis]
MVPARQVRADPVHDGHPDAEHRRRDHHAEQHPEQRHAPGPADPPGLLDQDLAAVFEGDQIVPVRAGRQLDRQPDLGLLPGGDGPPPLLLRPSGREDAVGGADLEDRVLGRHRAEIADGDPQLALRRGAEPGQQVAAARQPGLGDDRQPATGGLLGQRRHRVAGHGERRLRVGRRTGHGRHMHHTGTGLGRFGDRKLPAERSVRIRGDGTPVAVGTGVGAADHVLSADQQREQRLGPPAAAGDGDAAALARLLGGEPDGGFAVGGGDVRGKGIRDLG